MGGGDGIWATDAGTPAAAGVDPRDPWGNLPGAAEVLRLNYLTFQSRPLAPAAYNAGSGAVRRYNGVPPFAETTWYVQVCLEVYAQLRRYARTVSFLTLFAIVSRISQ
ncbi:MAG TPA: lytic transglycosylase domain-containing protein [bacterium]|nr:lytic transglycosylase domain-containing protein [bacterium]